MGILIALATGLLSAGLCLWIGTPLPWIVGPLFGTAALQLAGAGLRWPVAAREAGQWAIGTVLGLYFTAPVLAVLAAQAGYIALAVAFALGLGWLGARMLQQMAGVGHATAFFAMALGGASEMAVQGERHGADVQRVAAAHSVRLMLVVAALPFGLRWWSGHGMPAAGPHTGALAAAAATAAPMYGLPLLIALTCAAALLFKHRAIPNAWVLGPLLVAALLAAFGFNVGRVPEWMVRAGQLCIGVSLGTRFAPGFLSTAPRYLASVALCTLVAVGLAALFGVALAMLAGFHPATALLATSPGGIAEMALTARTLNLDVAVVTAFHVCRMLVLVLAVGPAFRRLA